MDPCLQQRQHNSQMSHSLLGTDCQFLGLTDMILNHRHIPLPHLPLRRLACPCRRPPVCRPLLQAPVRTRLCIQTLEAVLPAGCQLSLTSCQYWSQRHTPIPARTFRFQEPRPQTCFQQKPLHGQSLPARLGLGLELILPSCRYLHQRDIRLLPARRLLPFCTELQLEAVFDHQILQLICQTRQPLQALGCLFDG